MTELRDPILDADLDAYVDDQLDVARRIEVEAYLSSRPEAAARVMSDLRSRDELRLALAGSNGMARPATSDAARRLERALTRDRYLKTLQRMAAVGVLVAGGWLAHATIGPLSVTKVVASTPPPAYVEDAIRAHKTTMVRAGMNSQPEVTDYDEAEIRAATGIVMPELPGDWRVTDMQVYPSQFGPSVELALQAGDLGPLSLFAVRPGEFDVVPVTISDSTDVAAAYWQVGEVAYALVVRADAHDLERTASRLADTLY
jgi:anti-sigma factor RsiW